MKPFPAHPVWPYEFSRRVALFVTGLSPQVVTETLYALSIAQTPPFVPTEVHVITTGPGAARVRGTLLSEGFGWFPGILRDYNLPPVRFDETTLHVLTRSDGSPLDDIRTTEENELVADCITEKVREFTLDSRCALHVSLSGGRKTMSFYAGYAMSLLGRRQDRLSHVLVSSPYEANENFYYPTPYSRVIFTPPPLCQPLDTKEAKVTLIEIPFVRLRHGMPTEVMRSRVRFSEAVRSVSETLGPVELAISFKDRRARFGGKEVGLKPVDLAFLAWLARRAKAGLPGVCRSGVSTEDKEAFLGEYRKLHDALSGDVERVEHALRRGMDSAYFDARLSHLKRALFQALGERAKAYAIVSDRRRPESRYALRLLPEQIVFEEEERAP